MTNTIYTRTQNFLEKSKYIHGNKYDYSKILYINSRTKVGIICPEHGLFLQKPMIHLRGKGCLECGKIKKSISKTKSNKEFILELINKYGEQYDYSKVKYTNCHDKIDIICYIHGLFNQQASAHLNNGQGCPKCAYKNHSRRTKKDSIESNEYCVVYDIKLTGNGETFYKTGVSKEMYIRHDNISRSTPYKIEVLNIIHDTRYNCEQIENKILKKRQRINKYTPKIKFGGWGECYKL